MTRPALLFYCQHSLGLGHAVRSFALAAALAERFRVVLACGGELPEGLTPPDELDVIELPALRASRDGELAARGADVGQARRRRRALLGGTFESLRPAAVVLELFPFGRRRFADELVPLLEDARTATPRPLVVSSVRDLLVERGPDQPAHDTLSCVLANRYLNAILVHSDPRFARFGESFRPGIPLTVPVRHTGFVVREAGEPGPPPAREPRVLVSAGGGLVGAPLLRAAVEARPLLPADLRLEIVAGPFLPEAEWLDLRRAAHRTPDVELHRFVPDLGGRLRSVAASVSQCGYNTALDVLRAGVPALVVPFREGRENEQSRRATRLERHGAVRVLDPERLDASTLANEIRALLRFDPTPLVLDFDGAQASATHLSGLVQPAEAAAV
jgi:predicted glycosyltransferase